MTTLAHWDAGSVFGELRAASRVRDTLSQIAEGSLRFSHDIWTAQYTKTTPEEPQAPSSPPKRHGRGRQRKRFAPAAPKTRRSLETQNYDA